MLGSMPKLICWASLSLGLLPSAGAQDLPAGTNGTASGEEVTPAHVHQTVATLRNEIDLIRLEMGKAKAGAPMIQVEGAAPREVYFQAVAMFRKADRLAFEHTLEQTEPPPIPGGEITPTEVRVMVYAALDRVVRVKENLGIPELSEPPSLEPAVTPDEVFNSIIAANRDLNDLLDRQFAPGDVYQQVSIAIAYAARLLDRPGRISTPPEAPPRDRRKRPSDVYRELVACFDQIRRIGDLSGVAMPALRVDDALVDGAQPSDVYDMASLLVSELAHLHGLRKDAAPPRGIHNPGRKLPSDVYQRVGILRRQMDSLLQEAESNPDWLED